MNQQLLTVTDIHQKTGISKRTIQAALKAGRLKPALTVPGGYLIDPQDLDTWLDARRTRNGAAT